MFLPQLIQSAGAAQAAFEVIRERLSGQPGQREDRGTIVLATVKGDIHDIGKNIVKVLLENYGYTVVDLGKDVDPAAVAEAVRKHRAPLVGLSALMTTTLKSMADTITLLHLEGLPCKIMVGGRCSPRSMRPRSRRTSTPGMPRRAWTSPSGSSGNDRNGAGRGCQAVLPAFLCRLPAEKGLTAPTPLRVSQGSAILRTERRRRP